MERFDDQVDPVPPGGCPSVLVLRMEPTGYTVALVRALRASWRGRVNVIFVGSILTQKWTPDPATLDARVLPEGTARSLEALRRHIVALSPGLIHTPGWGSPQSIMAILTSSALGIPVTADSDTWIESPSRWRGALKRKLFDRVTHFTPAGTAQAAYLEKHGVARHRITPIHMTVDVRGIRRNIAASGQDARAQFRGRLSIPTGGLVALFVGRLVDLKGVDTLLAAWQEVSARHLNAHLVFVGDGQLRGKLEKLAGGDFRIHVIGRMSEADIWQAYAASDFLVGSSRFEPWGLVVNEAMAAGLPTIVTDRYGCAVDLVKSGETGLVVPADSSSAMAKAIGRLIADDVLRRKMAFNAADLISGWTIEAQADRMANMWQKCLTGAPGQC